MFDWVKASACVSSFLQASVNDAPIRHCVRHEIMHVMCFGDTGASALSVDNRDDLIKFISNVTLMCPSITSTHITHSLISPASHNATASFPTATRAPSSFAGWQGIVVWRGCMLLFDYCVCLFTWDLCAGHNGIALRTLVYHEVMVGYLDYIKRQGFTSMFIWACPPLQVC